MKLKDFALARGYSNITDILRWWQLVSKVSHVFNLFHSKGLQNFDLEVHHFDGR